jgi:hypothetical protein
MNDIDRILREDARVPLPDDGFGARVMEALPPRAHAARAWLHPALVFGSAALGCVLAVALAPAGGSLLQGFADLAQLRALTPAAITAIAIGGALLVSALVLATDLD